jgi:hypothetical protein
MHTEGMVNIYGENYEIPYVFPRRAVYAIVVIGEPRDGASFKPFRIEFDLRVEREVERTQQSVSTGSDMPVHVYIMLFVVTSIVMFLFVAVGILLVRRFKHKKQ